ncbi:MAG: RNA-binding protein [Anaerolineae bacterium]|nr:RNA-binding protein [Anaerolineae bacterium]
MNIYVGNVSYTVSEDELKDLFATYGTVSSVALIKDKMTGQMRGFGFVEMPNDAEAQAAIQALNGKDFKGRNLAVNAARPREERSGGGGGGRYGGGGGGRGGDKRGSSYGRRNSW